MRRWLAPALGLVIVLAVTVVALDLFVDDVLPTLLRPAPSSAVASATSRLFEPVELWVIAQQGRSVTTSNGEAQISTVVVGQVLLPSGRVVVADPFLTQGVPALQRTVAAGRYPVSVLVASFPDGDQRVAVAMLKTGSGQPATWELATTPDQALVSLAPDSFLGYGVDSGNGSFTSPEAAAALAARPITSSLDDDPILKALSADPTRKWSSADVILDPTSGLDVVAFSSGWGDGAYPSWWGLDSAGRPVVLMTDFAVLDAPPGASPSSSPPPSSSPS